MFIHQDRLSRLGKGPGWESVGEATLAEQRRKAGTSGALRACPGGMLAENRSHTVARCLSGSGSLVRVLTLSL